MVSKVRIGAAGCDIGAGFKTPAAL